MFIKKESSFASYDLLRECKHDGLSDKGEHIATVCGILSDNATVVIVPLMLHSGFSVTKIMSVLCGKFVS